MTPSSNPNAGKAVPPGPVEIAAVAHIIAVRERLRRRNPDAVTRPKPVVRHLLPADHPARLEARAREQAALAVLAARWQNHEPAPYEVWPPSVLTSPASPLTQREIIAQVCAAHGVRLSQILGPARDRELVYARQELCYRLRTERNLTWAQIGLVISRDHTTVLYSYRTHAKRVGKPV